jgi:two-component system OmpR family sensor kinase/two-component system sensor histidine kinase BaeS
MHRAPFFRRLGCFFALLTLFGLGFFLLLFVLLRTVLGLGQPSAGDFQWMLPLGVLSLVFIFAILAAAGRSLRRLSMPLDEMLAASQQVAEGEYSARVGEKGPPEMRSLARGFNSMAARLQAHSEQRRNMFADISHELRTPLTVIQGNVEGMLDGLYPVEEDRLRSILEETQLLSRLVDDLRTLSLAESGALPLRKEPVDLAGLIRETASTFRPRALEAGVELKVGAADTVPSEVDPARIREVLSNLLTNALHYAPHGSSIRLQYDGRTISVEDNGPGIAEADLPHIFERFYKSGDSGGMGLGLSIAKYLVEAHGGEIQAESVPGQGTKISFTLPD